MKTYGYARVSTDDQDMALQFDAMASAGVPRHSIFTDKLSGGRDDRPGLEAALASLGTGDSLVIWKLDRLWRSAKHALITLDRIKGVGATLRSLTEGFDLDTASGKLMATILAGFAEYERALIQERTRAGLAAAKARGTRLGAKPVLVDEKYIRAREMLMAKIPGHRIASALGCSQATIYKTFPSGRKALLAAASGV
ncbi:recombinase family protein [Magnetospirillum sulfuroxidans]|uniref:Recombinase family protein n=1 Tax=Magnetospirillum sulfuroxidans TaxID=611300 RepID=A0ABS5I8U6_9PROT|nr:recombinase family protein [Magnetospirillum sulfuroxidans]MBR9970837.1 recombinase family protein [Magnetospirillum sulfuroxidans]